MPVLSLLLTVTAQDMSSRLKADAQDARQQLEVVFVRVGKTFKKVGQGAKEGAIAVGHGAKEGGVNLGHATTTVGKEAGQGAGKLGVTVKKRAKRIGQGVKEAFTAKP